MANNAQQLFAVYPPDFEAHMFNGEVWAYKKSAAYSTAGLDHVKENLSISNMLLDLQSCGPNVLKVTVLQQWSRRQMAGGKLQLFQTATVQDETWVLMEGDNRVYPTKHDLGAPPFDPHGLIPSADHSK